MSSYVYDPWKDVDQRPDIDYLLDDGLPAGRGDGWWLPWLRLIVVRQSLHPTHSRCVMAHELVHVDHDHEQLAHHGPEGTRLARRQETVVDRIAARRLVALDDLVRAIRTHADPCGVAAELDVTEQVLSVRLEHLDDDERSALAEALRGVDHAA